MVTMNWFITWKRLNTFLQMSLHRYSRVPNTTVGNLYSFFGACPSYMALFGTTLLLNFKKSSFLHFYSELLAYWFFPLHHFTTKSFCFKYDLRVYWWIFDFLHWKIFDFIQTTKAQQKKIRSNSSPQTADSKCLKTYWLPCSCKVVQRKKSISEKFWIKM